MKNYYLLSCGILMLALLSCNDNSPSTETVTTNTVTINNNADKNTDKTDAEVILEGGQVILNATMNLVEKQRIKDSINAANKEKMYAYQIGLMYKEKDAYEAYKKLAGATMKGVSMSLLPTGHSPGFYLYRLRKC